MSALAHARPVGSTSQDRRATWSGRWRSGRSIGSRAAGCSTCRSWERRHGVGRGAAAREHACSSIEASRERLRYVARRRVTAAPAARRPTR